MLELAPMYGKTTMGSPGIQVVRAVIPYRAVTVLEALRAPPRANNP